jgi:hypothetical protein
MAEPWSDGDVLTAAHLAGMPWGVMGYDVGSTSDQTGISSVTDITGLSVTFTAVSTRLYIAVLTVCVSQQTSGGAVDLYLRDGASATVHRTTATLATNDAATIQICWPETGLSGSTTRKGSVSTSAGTMTVVGNASRNASLIIYDLAAG